MAIVNRVPVPGIELQEAVQPRAEIVDSYVRPATPTRSNLWEVAEGLQSFSSGLKGFFAKRDAEQANKDAIRGEAAFIKNNSMSYAEAVRTGAIPSFASPEFVTAYKKAEGANTGRRLAAKFALEYQQWEGRNSQDPAAFDAFVSDFMSRNLAGVEDPDILAGAMPFITQTVGQGYATNTVDRSNGLMADSINTSIAGSSQDIDSASDLGIASKEGTDYDALWDALIANRDGALSVGTIAEDYDKQFIALIAAKALEEGDPELLALLDRKVPGEEYSFAETPYGRGVKAETLSAMETASIRRENHAYTQQEREQAAKREAFMAAVQETLAANPTHMFDEEFLQAYSMVDPEARTKVMDLQRKFMENATNAAPESEEDVLRIYEQLFAGAGREAIDEAYRNGVITEPSTYSALVGFWESLNGGKDGKKSPSYEDPTFKANLKRLQRMTAPQGPKDAFYNPDLQTDASLAVTLDYYLMVGQWDRDHPKAGVLERMQAHSVLYQMLRAGIVEATFVPTTGIMATPATYTRPKGTGLPETAFQQDTVPPPPPRQEPTTPDVWGGTAAPALEALSPEERTYFENRAKQQGLDPRVLVERTWRTYRDAGDTTSPE